MESKYGESISVKDITGSESTKRQRSKLLLNPVDEHPAGAGTEAAVKKIIVSGGDVSNKVAQRPGRRKAATDVKNEAFEEWLRNRQPRNFLAEQVRDGLNPMVETLFQHSWLFSCLLERACASPRRPFR